MEIGIPRVICWKKDSEVFATRSEAEIAGPFYPLKFEHTEQIFRQKTRKVHLFLRFSTFTANTRYIPCERALEKKR